MSLAPISENGAVSRTNPRIARESGSGLMAIGRLFTRHAGQLPMTRLGGSVSEVSTSHIRARGLAIRTQLGTQVEIESEDGSILGEVIGIQPDCATIKLFSSAPRLGLGSRIWIRERLSIRPDPTWLGRVINALGEPIDQKGTLATGTIDYDIDRAPIAPLAMDRVKTACHTGVRTIDLFTPICTGQRIGIFAAAGVGKSTLISMLTRSSGFDTIVVALVAERAREVREFIEDVIQPCSSRAVTVVATSSESPMMRKLAANTAMTVAEYFRDLGDNVLLVVNSLTRYAHALREVALAAGELPVARGYTPSVFAELPRLLERAGPGSPVTGSITGIFSVLVEGDDHNEPVADTVRGILDGHIVLDRAIADQSRYPAINPLTSLSRLASLAWSKDEATLVRRLRALIARFEDTRELRTLGAYKPGADPELDQAMALVPALYEFMTQMPGDPPTGKVFDELAAALSKLKAQEMARQERDQKQTLKPSRPD